MRFFTFFKEVFRNRLSLINQPRFFTYCVTYRCQARCRMCDSWKKAPGEELTLNEIEKFFGQLPQLNGVRLTGGEPFLRADFIEIVTLVQDILKPPFFHISSNGLLTKQIVDLCERRKKNIHLHLMISLDGWGNRHDEIRGVSSAWEKTIFTLKSLAHYQKALNISLSVNQTILDLKGMEDYKKIQYFCNQLGIEHYVVFAYEGSAIYDVEPEVIRCKPDGDNLIKKEIFGRHNFITRSREIKFSLNQLPFFVRLAKHYYHEGIYNRWLKQQKTPQPPCVALRSHLRLLPDGGIPICQFNSKLIGHLRKATFNQIWNSYLAQQARRWVKTCSGCWAECEVLPNAIYSGDLIFYYLKKPGKLFELLFVF